MSNLTRLTLSNGKLTTSDRSSVSPAAIEMLMPLVAASGGTINQAGWRFKIVHSVFEGACGFTLHHGNLSLLACYTAWTEAADRVFWNGVKGVAGIVGPAIRKPKTLPWLLVQAMPHTELVSADILAEASNFDHAIAWAIIEAYQAEDRTV